MRQLRINILVITTILICIGLVMIYSTTSIYAQEKFNDGMFFLKRHLLFLFIGCLLCLFILYIDYKVLKRFSKPLLMLMLILLVLVLVPGIGYSVSGAQRWFRFGRFSFQPSEMANVVLIVYIAGFINRKQNQMGDFLNGYLPVILVSSLTSGLILLQPDLGTALAIFFVAALLIYIGGTPISYLIFTLLGSLPLLYIMILRVPYRRMRILAFLNP